LVGARLEECVFGQNLDSLDARIALGWPGRAGGNPFGKNLVFERIDLETFAALVRYGSRRFEKKKAATWIGRNDSSSEGIAGEREEIPLVVIATQGQFESVLPGCRAVTGAGAATELRQDGLDMIAEGDVRPGRETGGFLGGASAQPQDRATGETRYTRRHKPTTPGKGTRATGRCRPRALTRRHFWRHV